MKKLLMILLCLVMALAVLAGCQTQTQTQSPTTPEGKKVITIGIPKSTRVLDYDTNSYTLWLEEVSGYEIQFVPYATSSSDYKKQLASDIAGELELPDILLGFTVGDVLVEQYGEDGYFIDLSEYYKDEEKSANFRKMLKDYLSADEQQRVWEQLHAEAEDGDWENAPMYYLPSIETTLIDTMDFMPMINQNWLDKLHIEKAPETPEELLNVLRRFKNEIKAPDGSTIYPLLGPAGDANSPGGSTIDWLINFFIYQNDSYHFNLDANGNLYLPYNQEAYKEALKYIHTLYEEGLMHQSTLTATYKGVKPTLSTTDLVGVTVIHPSQGFDLTNDCINKWVPLNLYGNVYYNDNTFSKNVFITDSCDDPEAAWDLLMHMYTYESALRQRYGVPGEDWDYADEGATSVMGLTASIKVYNDIWGTNNNKSWNVLRGGVFPYAENEVTQATGNESDALKHKYELYVGLTTNFNAALEKVDKTLVCPKLTFNTEEKEMAPYRQDLKDAVNTWQAEFINGTKDIDKDWGAYLDDLNTLGLNDYIAAGQHCYDRTYKNAN